MSDPFRFYTPLHLVQLLGVRATNAVELLAGIRTVPAASIYYHTHRFLQQHHYLSPEPPNDFAYWLTNILRLEELGESIASLDTVSYRNIEELRREFIRVLANYVSKGNNAASCPEGGEFHFVSCAVFILPTPHIAHTINEFVDVLDKISINSLYYHVFEARMRLEKDDNDFSAWFKGMGEDRLAQEISRLDPYNMTLEGLRKRIVGLVHRYASH